jgi:hypothetical protein
VFRGHFPGFVLRVNGKGNKPDAILFEIVVVTCKIGELPIAERSPRAAIDQDNRPESGQVMSGGNFLSVEKGKAKVREEIPRIQGSDFFSRHIILLF